MRSDAPPRRLPKGFIGHVYLLETRKIEHGLIGFEQGAGGIQYTHELKSLVENGPEFPFAVDQVVFQLLPFLNNSLARNIPNHGNDSHAFIVPVKKMHGRFDESFAAV